MLSIGYDDLEEWLEVGWADWLHVGDEEVEAEGSQSCYGNFS